MRTPVARRRPDVEHRPVRHLRPVASATPGGAGTVAAGRIDYRREGALGGFVLFATLFGGSSRYAFSTAALVSSRLFVVTVPAA